MKGFDLSRWGRTKWKVKVKVKEEDGKEDGWMDGEHETGAPFFARVSETRPAAGLIHNSV